MIMKQPVPPRVEPPMEIIFDEPPRKRAGLEWSLLAIVAIGLVVGAVYGWNDLASGGDVAQVPEPVPVIADAPDEAPVVLVQDPDDEVRAWILEAQKVERNNPGRAADLYTRVVEFQPDRSGIWKTIGQLRLESGEEGPARQAFQAYLDDHPRDASVLGTMAALEVRAGRRVEAEDLFRRALQEAPSARLWYSLGNLHLGKGDEGEAIDAYREAVKLDPGHGDARFNLALALERENRIREAAGALEGIDDPVARGHRERLLAKLGGIPAEQVFRRSEGEKDSADLGRIAAGFEAAGKWKEAKEILDRAVKISPDDVAIRHNRGALSFRLGNFEEARHDYLVALELDPQHAETHFNMGLLHEREEKLAEALRSYEAALQSAPGHAGSMNNIGALYLRVGKPGPAAAIFRKVLEKNPGHAEAQLNLAWSHLARDDREEALAALNKYVTLVPPGGVDEEVLGKIRLLGKNR